MNRIRLVCALTAALIAAGTPGSPSAAPENPYAPDRPEPGSVERIREYTTGAEYLPPSVAYVPDSDTVPSPREVLGHEAGAPEELSDTRTVYRYFRKLAAASPRVEVRNIGTTVEGREILLAVISSEENLARLDRLREITGSLAGPRTTGRAAMEELAGEGRVIYYLTGGLHSTETGPPEMLMELAYRLAVSERPDIRSIRANTVVLITPVMEPDGRDRVVQWYYRHLKGRDLPFEDLDEFSSPPTGGTTCSTTTTGTGSSSPSP